MRGWLTRTRRLGAATAIAAALTTALAPSVASAVSPTADPEVELRGNVSAGLNQATRVADEDAGRALDIQFSLQLRNRPQLDDLIRRVSTKSSPEYGHYLAPAQFRAQFGPTAASVEKAVSFLQAGGLTVTAAAPGSPLIDARGSVAAVQRALHTSIGRYHEASGREFFANDAAPALPASIASTVVGVVGLDNRHQLHHSGVQPRVCPPTCGSLPYTPNQVRTAYQMNAAPLAALTGSGQKVGLFELDDFRQANLDAYDAQYSLPALTPLKQAVAGGPTITNGGELEVELDIELMHAIAPGAQVMVFEGPNSLQTDVSTNDTYRCMVDPALNAACPNHASLLTAASNSTSWGSCESAQLPAETATLSTIFSQAAAQGQSFFAAAGDNGAHDCTLPTATAADPALAVDSPASDPNVTGVGGTNLQLNTDSSINLEVAWSKNPNPWNGSGGGASTIFSRPSWQVGPGVDTSVGARRQVPDVALDADPNTGYSIYSCTSSALCTGAGAGWLAVAGTSAAAPAWAAFTAIYNQLTASQAKPALGFANPTLYQLAACPQAFPPFNDVTAGGNRAGTATGYSAGPNYDMVTGLGTLRASDLAQDAAGTATPIVKVSSLSQPVGVTGNTVHVFGCGFATSAGQTPSVTFGSHASSGVSYVSSTDLSVVVPFNFNGTVPITVTNPAGAGAGSASLPNAFTYNQPPAAPPPPGGTSLYGTLLDNTGSGRVEVHALSQASHYSQFSVHAATAFGSPTGATADWQFFIAGFHGDGQPDLFGVHLRNTGSGRVEVHVLSAASGYQTFVLHAATALSQVPLNQFQFAVGSFAGDRSSDLYAIILNNTGSNRVEVHVLSEASNYSTWLLHSASGLGTTSPTAWQFRIGDRYGSGDLVGILHTATGSGRTEVHILSRVSGYQTFTLHVATPLGTTTDSQFAYTLGDHDNDGIPDLYAVLMNGSGSGQTEIHVISGGSNYTAFIEQAASGLGPTSSSSPSWQFSTH